MNNIGTTMKALGRNDQAYEWWWKAIQACPTYWDAIVRHAMTSLNPDLTFPIRTISLDFYSPSLKTRKTQTSLPFYTLEP